MTKLFSKDFHTVYDEEIIGLFKGKIPIIDCK